MMIVVRYDPLYLHKDLKIILMQGHWFSDWIPSKRDKYSYASSCSLEVRYIPDIRASMSYGNLKWFTLIADVARTSTIYQRSGCTDGRGDY